MDQRELAQALDKSPSVISALVNHVQGPAAAGRKLKKQALDYLMRRIHGSESVVEGRSESEAAGVAIHERTTELKTVDQCLARIKLLEADNDRLRAMLRVAIEPQVNYGRRLSSTLSAAEESLLDEAEKPDSAGPAKS